MFKVEEPAMLVALVPESEVDAGTVLGGGPHEVGHDPGDVEGQLPLGPRRHLKVLVVLLLLLLLLGPAAGVDLLDPILSRTLHGLWSLLENSPLRLDLGLPPGLVVGPESQGLHNVPGVSQAAGHVHQRPVADHVGEVIYTPI